MIEIALIIRIMTIIVTVIQELWDGPLGELIRDLTKKP